MIQEHTWYTTSDGQGFSDKERAEEWENILQSNWYRERTHTYSDSMLSLGERLLSSILF